MKHTPGPWKACHDGKCKCKQVWSETADHPVAIVECGKVGDDYPEVENGKAVMKQITYWEIGEEVAEANAHLIAAAPDMLEALENLIKANWPDAIDEAFKQAKSAIRKAGGGK